LQERAWGREPGSNHSQFENRSYSLVDKHPGRIRGNELGDSDPNSQ